MAKERALRDKVAIAGIGETAYYKHGQAPHSEFELALQAILNACADAGVDPRRLDGFASYVHARALGKERRMSTLEVNAPNRWRLESPGHAGWARTARPGDPNKYLKFDVPERYRRPAA